MCKSLHHFILKYKEHKYFPIPRDFTQNLAILPWYGLIQSFVFIGRSYFHKNKKYEFACQLTGTEDINNKRKDDAMEKNILLDLECIALSTNTKVVFGQTESGNWWEIQMPTVYGCGPN